MTENSSRPALDARLLIHIPSYNACDYLVATVRRIPFDELPQGLSPTVIFVDNASTDGTQDEIRKAMAELSAAGVATHAIFHPENMGYGGSLKEAFAYAVDNEFEYMAVIHADGQYAPEELPRLLSALIEDPDMCTLEGSRLVEGALKGNMPLYKYVGGHILTFMQNTCSGLSLSEYHSGYRLYRVALAKQIPWPALSDGWVVDQEILFVFSHHGLKIGELPIPTHYGEEKSNVPLIGLPMAILSNMAGYLLARAGLRNDPRYPRN